MKTIIREGFVVYNTVDKTYNGYNNNMTNVWACDENGDNWLKDNRTFLKIYPDEKAAARSIKQQWHYGQDTEEYQKRFKIIPVKLTYEIGD